MAKTIKKVAHDLLPLSDAVTELSSIISQLLEAIEPHATFHEETAKKYFSDCRGASQKLTISSKLIREYIQELHVEANQEGIVKD